MSEVVWTILFWSAAAGIVWAYAGLPAVLALRALRPRPEPRTDAPPPNVSLVIVVHNERAVIDAKLANVEAIRYPRDRLEVVVASDGSDDGTEARVAAHDGATPVRLLALPRVGKNAALNAAVETATGEVLAFSDADSMLEPDGLLRLVAPFSDPSIGGVAGDYCYTASAKEGEGERAYWSLDRLWKQLASRGGSVTSATGQIYAIRSEYFERVPDGVTDDFFVSTGVIAAGRRLWFEPAAIARGPVADSADAEFRRKIRLIGRGFASVWERRVLLDPRRHGFYALQLLSHKVLRRLVGLPLLMLFAGSVALSGSHPFYAWAAIGQGVFHALALFGWLNRDRALGAVRAFAMPCYFDMVNIAALLALVDLLRGRRQTGWVPQRSEPPASRSAGAPGASAGGR